MARNTKGLDIRPTYWLVRVKEFRAARRPEYDTEVEDPQNGMVLGDDDADQDEDDVVIEFNVNSVRNQKPRKMLLTLQCPHREIVLETNSFAWPYPVWLTVRIAVYTNVISPKNHVIAESLQKGMFTPIEYFITDWLVSNDPTDKIAAIDLSGGIGHVYGVPLVSQFLSSVRPRIQGNSEMDLQNVQAYDRYKQEFCDYLSTRRGPNDIRLNDISSLLSDFTEEENLSDAEAANRRQIYLTLNQQLITTEEGNILKMSSDAPDFFRLGPLLFPNKISSLMVRPSEDTPSVAMSKTELFIALDELILNEPWKLGFSTLIYRYVQQKCTGKKWSGIETHLRQMKKATFYSDLSKEQKDALHVYDTIKVIVNIC